MTGQSQGSCSLQVTLAAKLIYVDLCVYKHKQWKLDLLLGLAITVGLMTFSTVWAISFSTREGM